MFTSLDEQMKHDAALGSTPKERTLKWTVIAVSSVVLFGGLFAAIQMFS